MSGHTKRSPEFKLEIDRLVQKLRANTLSFSEKSRLIQALESNTTDSACMVKAAENEPIFVLRGNDAIGAESVEGWISAAEGRGIHDDKIVDAQECADEMVAYSENRKSR